MGNHYRTAVDDDRDDDEPRHQLAVVRCWPDESLHGLSSPRPLVEAGRRYQYPYRADDEQSVLTYGRSYGHDDGGQRTQIAKP
jgi:hypothetical protein